MSMVAELHCEVRQEGGIALAAKPFYDIVKSLPGDVLSLTKLENQWAEIEAGRAKYRVVGLSDRDFPKLKNHREVEFSEVPSDALVQMISRTLFSVSTDDTRYHLAGIYLECDGKLATMVSTDGHRLSKAEVELGCGPKLEQGVIIPRKGVAEVRKLLDSAVGTCEVAVSQGCLFVRAGDIVLSVTLVDASFPPFQQVIPQSSDKRVVVGRSAFLDALRRISIMSSERSWGIRLELEAGRLRIHSDNPDLGEANEDIEVEYEGEALSVGFNARYFIDVLNEIDTDRVILELNGELDPGLLRPFDRRDYLGVVMPMRI
jgi:DNA polymerase III subunit beta